MRGRLALTMMMGALFGACLVPVCGAGAGRKPNVILFLVDDMGWMDCGVYGSRYYETPNMDRFATQAMRFTQAYSQPLCSPTRASILSGQYSARHGVTSASGHQPPQAPDHRYLPDVAPANAPLRMPQSKNYLDPGIYTLAEALRDAGYRTAHIGKWHLGLTEPHWPERQGFDVAFHCHPDPGPPGEYFSPYGVVPPGSAPSKERGVRQCVGTITDGPPGEYITDRITDEALKFIEANRDRPFYLNLWQYGVHGPWGHKEAYTREFAKRTDPTGRQGNAIMASMLRSVDESLGRVLGKIEELGLSKDTVILFTSDNGGNVHSNTPEDGKSARIKPGHPKYAFLEGWRRWAGERPPTNNAPLRDGKGRMYEGGVRVPLMVRWPGEIAAGTTSDAIVGCVDLYPTVLDLAGVPARAGYKLDGISYGPVLRGTGALGRDAYFIWFPHLVPGVSVRCGDWKLIRRFEERPGDYEGTRELFDLGKDLGETRNLAGALPEKVKELDALIDRFVAETGALYPQPNPAYKPRASRATAADPAAGLVARSCKIAVVPGALRVEADGRGAFLGTAQVKVEGPLVLKLRARGAAGGKGAVRWVTVDQEDFPESGQSAAFDLPAGDGWQDVSVAVPLDGRARILRLYLPVAGGPVEIESIRFFRAGSEVAARVWDFSRAR